MSVKTYTADQQRALLLDGDGMRQASFRTACLLYHNMREVEALSLERSMSLGVNEYSDKSFHMDRAELKQETFEELADAVFYQRLYDLREKGLLP